ncbi:MAG TPA: ABC transporter permease subunit [Nocardioides sp.]|uniref:ABC transporter permease n=1 Tax=Nocardioides sp. TaxID=35761 RepID=UPI002E304839|nr:ABC transporter permease subunit [Nocardioides sp.]HEX5086442.1 ABC transporter permease subunit [Nocardioides sp.]
MSDTAVKDAAVAVTKEQLPYVDPRKPRRTGIKLVGILVFWLVCYAAFKGQWTKALGLQDTTELQRKINDARDWIQLEGQDNWFIGGVLGAIGDALNSLVEFFQKLVSIPALPRPVPEIGWLGVVAIAAWVTFVFAGLRSTVLVTLSLLSFGVVGLWSESMDTLIITGISVAICIIIGLPVGIWMARSKSVSTAITPVLDLMQTFPAFCYLAPFALFFGIGPATAVILTLIYALPPMVRITEHGIRTVSATTIEAARSMGLTGTQMLRQVQLPMAKRTIVVGINQCMMAALSMATIAALVNGPGLGKPVVSALQVLNVGAASVAGLAIVVMAIMLDRTTTAASERTTGKTNIASASGMSVMLTGVVLERLPRWATEEAGRGQRLPRLTASGRWMLQSLLLIPVVVCVLLSRQQLRYAEFPDVTDTPVLKWISGPELTKQINRFTDWLVGGIDTYTIWIKDHVTEWIINPLQDLLSLSPWWVMALVLLAVAYALGGWRPAVITAVCEGVILITGLWNDSMVTLSMTLIATALVMVIAVLLGVAMGRSRRADLAIRPFLDAFQVIPPFVYLVPALALFLPGRFTAIIAATAYAVPIATKLVADGIRGVSSTTVEAARATGSTRWQMISKVQLPMARESLVLATNQGLLYVLSMVVIGGMVGGGSLGYIVVSGFSQDQLFGKGLCAGVAIAALGVMLDRIARYAAARYGN